MAKAPQDLNDVEAFPEHRWLGAFEEAGFSPRQSKIALIILNTPIDISQTSNFLNIWNRSSLRICADGGANRLFAFSNSLKENGSISEELVPDYIKGDLDSIQHCVKAHYESFGSCKVLHDSNQNSTDLGKCLELVEEFCPAGQTLIIHGGLTGRLDQTIHTLHTLLMLQSDPPASVEGYKFPKPRGETWVVDTDARSMACALRPQVKHCLSVPKSRKQECLTCGILPIGVAAAVVTTRGLRWNLTNTEVSMMGLLSTSNQVLEDTEIVEIITNQPVIWTMEIPICS
ncbi:hypothetical protein O181_034322 [Austropuccinia psidii MF-1]|uniref:Thiamine pyrophosphokinase n=1 Tax=Austropuccinia psidii MF-1 TaxID=1389203 RepID=A0A9Q3H7Z3_9BASI|nr:hypothetical protein [Austropuccinia psidii MF-1]